MSLFYSLLSDSGGLTVVSVETVPNVEVDFGVVFGSLGLPSALDVTLSDASVVSMSITWGAGSYNENVADSYDLTGTLTLPGGVTNPLSVVAEVTVLVNPPLFISGSELDVLNRFIIINFDPNVYGTGGTALQANDLQLIFAQNAGTATAASIASITQTDGTALAGGENAVKVNLTITGDPSGVETIEIKPAASASYEDGFGNLVSEDDTTGVVELEMELDPMYKAGILYALTNSIDVPNRAQRLVDNTLFTSWRTDGVLAEWDGLYLFTHSNDFSRFEFITGTYIGSFPSGAVTITPHVGGQVVAPVTTGYFDTGWNPLNNGVKYLQNDASVVVVIQNNAQSGSVIAGMRGSASGVNFGHTRLLPRNLSDSHAGIVNFNSTSNTTVGTVTDSEGVHMLTREASNLTKAYLNGSLVDDGTSASSTVSNRNLLVWSTNNDGTPAASNNVHIVMAVAYGAGQQDKLSEINTALQTWKTNSIALVPAIVADKLYSWCGQSNMDRAELLTDLDAGQTTLYNQGPYLISNTNYNSGAGFEANCYIWWDGEWQVLEPGVNGVDKPGGYFGPLYAFARAEAAKYPGEDLYFVVQAVGGTPMRDLNGAGANNWLPGGVPSSQFTTYQTKYNNAIAALTSVTTFMPFLWGQGESDCQTTTESLTYEANEITMLTQVYANTGHTDAVVMQIHGSLEAGTWPYRDDVRAAKVANESNSEYGTGGALISIDDLARQTTDPAHLTNTSSITFAGRMSAACP